MSEMKVSYTEWVAAIQIWHCFDVFCSFLVGDKFEDDDDDNDDGDDNPGTDRKPPAKKGKWSPNTTTTPLGANTSLNIHPMLQWRPQIAMSVWKNAQLHYMVTVAIPLTGGVDIDNDCKVYVSDDGNELIVSEKMVKMLGNIDLMHEHWRNKNPNAFPSNHPKIMGFHEYFSAIRKRENDDIFTTATIKLPFPVQKTIVDTHKLGNKTGVQMLYVDLRAVDYSDYKAASKSELVMVD